MKKKMFKGNMREMSMLISLLEKFVQTVPFYVYIGNLEKEKPEVLWEKIRTNA